MKKRMTKMLRIEEELHDPSDPDVAEAILEYERYRPLRRVYEPVMAVG